ncbi:adenosylcobinamide-GDP ribazoletransferase [Paenibacillus endophyticus]|uniref:Adenosylcobinamide-GDP ribazoletransferase n=1 Tax=Paenibacillus endophyticus TaxID=1294268 RepID=A0A7W5C784_9BACL|nr:adenosylcobinamide-GDP ribazoletransferase [Paenibacillus endophyticus]MBB3151995.1 adenosylcobinamide-GDP ribazoletransferase [Paenibacillus endophyticus]
MFLRELKLQAQALAAALQFLTRFPVPVNVAFHGPVLSRSVVYFPVAGMLLGACLYGFAWLFSLFVPAWPSAVLMVGLWTALSGGLHLDGLMDTADGVLSHRSRDRMLEIMKDSRVGAMGVLAAVLLLMLKASLLAELLSNGLSASDGCMLMILPIWSRAWMSAAIAQWPFARVGEGIAVLFNEVKGVHAVAAMLLAAISSTVILVLAGHGLKASLLWLLAFVIVTTSVGGGLAAWLNRKLGGLTGDTYGAMNEMIEAMLLLVVVIWLHAQ